MVDYSTILDKADTEQRNRAEQMPTEMYALRQLNQAYLRLKELGFHDVIYCPKDGTKFDAIVAESAEILTECWYQGDWPNGHWRAWYDNDSWPIQPILFRIKLPHQK